MADGFDVSGLEELELRLARLAQSHMPKETRQFLREEGNKLRKYTQSLAKLRVKVKTGNYLKGVVTNADGEKSKAKGKWRRGAVYLYRPDNAYTVRVYNNAPHAHLIEDGHDMVGHKPKKTKLGVVEGYHILADASKAFEGTYFADTLQFVDRMLEGGLY